MVAIGVVDVVSLIAMGVVFVVATIDVVVPVVELEDALVVICIGVGFVNVVALIYEFVVIGIGVVVVVDIVALKYEIVVLAICVVIVVPGVV